MVLNHPGMVMRPVLILVLLLLLPPPLPLRAAELLFASIEAPPWAGLDERNQPAGAFVDIVAELRRRTGHAIAIGLYSLPRLEREMESGASDCAIFLWSDRRERYVRRGEVVYGMPFGVIARPGVRLESYDDLLPLSLSIIRNLRFDPHFDADTRLHREYDKDYLAGLLRLERRRVDAIAGALPTIEAQARNAGLGHVLGRRLVLAEIPLALQCSQRSRQLGEMASLDAALREMRQDGTLSRLLAVYGYH